MSPIDKRLNTLGIGLPDVMPPVVGGQSQNRAEMAILW
jgi:hypothetical protein